MKMEREEEFMTESDSAAIAPQPLDAWFLELLECVGCDQHLPLHLGDTQQTLICHCGRYAFPIRDGIPILLVEEATVLDSEASPTATISNAAEDKTTGE
jgi:uncharacterized protein YbaR (Trm112 family)